MDAYERAERIADALNATGEVEARVWKGTHQTRVYVTRELSRGRQDMGYIGIDPDTAEITDLPTHRTSWVEQVAESA